MVQESHCFNLLLLYIYFVRWLSGRGLLILESKPSLHDGEEEKNGIVLYSCIRHIYFSIFQISKTPRLIINNPTYQGVEVLIWNKVCKVPSREPDSYLAFWRELIVSKALSLTMEVGLTPLRLGISRMSPKSCEVSYRFHIPLESTWAPLGLFLTLNPVGSDLHPTPFGSYFSQVTHSCKVIGLSNPESRSQLTKSLFPLPRLIE